MRPLLALALLALALAGCTSPAPSPAEPAPPAPPGFEERLDQPPRPAPPPDCSDAAKPASVRWIQLPRSVSQGLSFNVAFEAEPDDACIDFRAVHFSNRTLPAAARYDEGSSRADTGRDLGSHNYQFRIVAPLGWDRVHLRGLAMGGGVAAWSEEAVINTTAPPSLPPDAGDCSAWPTSVPAAQANPGAARASGPLRVEPHAFDHAGARCVLVLSSGCGFCGGAAEFRGDNEHWALVLFENLRVALVEFNGDHGDEVGFHVEGNITYDGPELRSVLANASRAEHGAVWVSRVRTGVVDGAGASTLFEDLRRAWTDRPPPPEPCADCAYPEYDYWPAPGEAHATHGQSDAFGRLADALRASVEARGLAQGVPP